jgi:hypothetical protein
MRYIKDRRPKICFAKAGDVIRIPLDRDDYGPLDPSHSWCASILEFLEQKEKCAKPRRTR